MMFTFSVKVYAKLNLCSLQNMVQMSIFKIIFTCLYKI